MRLENKVAIITGAGMGMGREASLLFAKEGARIVACDINEAAMTETVALVEEAGGEALAVHCDVSKEADIKQAVAAGVEKFRKLDILYANAGFFSDKTWHSRAAEKRRRFHHPHRLHIRTGRV